MEKRGAARHGFRCRGQEIQRIETLSDAVFAFAVTLLIVSLEVPKSFDELLNSMRGFASFGVCFLLLLSVWYDQHLFFRRYGLEDKTTIFLNGVLLFIVLFYVYPLKFLFSLFFSDSVYGAGKTPFSIRQEQVPQLMVIYGIGYIIIYVVMLLMYLQALRCRMQLDLTPVELFDTRSKIYSQVILIAIGVCSIIVALALPDRNSSLAGLVYLIIGPAIGIFYSKRARLRRKVHSA